MVGQPEKHTACLLGRISQARLGHRSSRLTCSGFEPSACTGRAGRLSERPISNVEGTLAYVAPEQASRCLRCAFQFIKPNAVCHSYATWIQISPQHRTVTKPQKGQKISRICQVQSSWCHRTITWSIGEGEQVAQGFREIVSRDAREGQFLFIPYCRREWLGFDMHPTEQTQTCTTS